MLKSFSHFEYNKKTMIDIEVHITVDEETFFSFEAQRFWPKETPSRPTSVTKSENFRFRRFNALIFLENQKENLMNPSEVRLNRTENSRDREKKSVYMEKTSSLFLSERNLIERRRSKSTERCWKVSWQNEN